MTDYGQELRFGSFITPAAAAPDDVVALARLSERVGLDLVTVQDHPYQPAFLDTWTLLSHLGALTSTVRLAPNVANLPLRPPAVLARSAASLDLLTGGRVELGLGAGAFWDAVEAMGGRRLSLAQAVRAVAEAIEIVRGVWDASERRPLRVPGEIHHVAGAKRGPAPAHPVEIWLGAYKPRMLALAGRAADGWLPSLGYLDLADAPAAHAVIDEAAVEAGRDPAAVRRLLNVTGRLAPRRGGLLVGPPEQWVAELAELVLEHGFSTFVLGGDDPRALEVLGHEVAPAVRELVAAERAGRAERDVAAGVPGGAPDGVLDGAAAASGGAAVREPSVPAGTVAGSRTTVDGRRGDAVLGVATTPAPARLLERSLLDEATRPRHPAPGGATHTDEGRAVGAHLVEVHDMLRAELEKVRDVVTQVRTGVLDAGQARSEIATLTLRQNAWTMGAYCASYCRVVTGHHTLEDESVFPHLRDAEPALGPMLDRLADEHHVIHDVLERVDRALVDVVRTGSGTAGYEALQEAVDGLTDTLLSHFAYEEEQLVEPLARVGFYPGQVSG